MYWLGRTQMLAGASYEDGVRRLMAAGFDGVELGVYDKDFRLRPEFFATGFARRMKFLFQECNVQAYSVGAHMDYVEYSECFDAVRRTIPIAKQMGAAVVIITGAMRKEGVPIDRQYEAQRQKTRQLCRVAEENDVKLAMEFEPGFVIDHTNILLRLIREVNSSALKINLDIGHVFLQDPDPLQAIAMCKGLVAHAHVENMQHGVHNHLVPYEGDMDLAAYLAQLKRIGFDGCAALDVYQYDYEKVAAESLRYLRRLARHLPALPAQP